MGPAIENVIQDASALVSPPDVWITLNEVVANQTSTASDIADVVMCDPSLTARVLKIVNSPVYRFRSQIHTVTRAVAILGTNELFALATAIASVDVFSKLRCDLLSVDAFWKHSLATAIMAKRLARESCVLHPERLYVAGLLHDVGYLLLYLADPERAEETTRRAEGDEEQLLGAERELFGFDHAQLGAELLRQWNLPGALIGAIACHHRPGEAGDAEYDAALVHLANYAANDHMLGLFVERAPEAPLQSDEAAWRITSLTPKVVDTLGADLDTELAIALSLFLPERTGRGSP